MKYPQNTYLYNGTRVKNTWIKTTEIEKYSPITQVYGIIFDDEGKILIGRDSKGGSWIIPGGHPEKGESVEETLKREVLEEVDVEINNIKPLGVQKATFPDDPDKSKVVYQVRCTPQTPDPANDSTWERKFVSSEKINKYVKWGSTGAAMFEDAISLFKL